MNDLKIYDSIRDEIRPGDVIAFGGEGFISDAIKFLTLSSVSHVGVVLDTKVLLDGEPQPGRIVNIIESTTLNGKSGVQVNRLSDRLREYDGRTWWLPLDDTARATLDLPAFFSFLLKQEGKEYDYQGVLAFLARNLPFGYKLFPGKNLSKLFCSELIAAAFQAGGLLHGIRPGLVHPQGLCEMSIYDRSVQLTGTEKDIKNFNSV